MYIYIYKLPMSQQNRSVHWGINFPQKLHPLFPAKPPSPLTLETVQDPLFRQSPLYIGFW